MKSVDCLQLDLSDGLKSLEFEGPNQRNSCRTPDGRLWFAKAAGLAVVDPQDLYTNQLAPQIAIDGLVVDGHPVPLKATLARLHAPSTTKATLTDAAPLVIPPRPAQV